MRSKYDLAFHNVPNQKYIRISHLIQSLYCYIGHVMLMFVVYCKKKKKSKNLPPRVVKDLRNRQQASIFSSLTGTRPRLLQLAKAVP